MLANSRRHNYYSYIWRFESDKCGKEEKKIQKIEYLENEKSFLDNTKSIFHKFWNAFFW